MIKIGVVGYGNLGRGVCLAIAKNDDMELVGIFTRRNPSSVNPAVKANVYSVSELDGFIGKIDVLILCGGSATDLPSTTAEYIKRFNAVDSFDTHARIPEYYAKLDKIAKENGTLNAISIGWDPGLFSVARLIFGSVLPNGKDYTFWGKGVSQGHSDAVRRIDGVVDAIQYTIPREEALKLVRSGANPELSVKDKHLREVFVTVAEGADKERIEQEIKSMPNYFADYDTTVNFISKEELDKNHKKLSHGGSVIRSGSTTQENSELLELSLKLDSNPEFTGSVLVAYARAVYKMRMNGATGTVTAFDIPLKYLSPKSEEELRASIL